ncbi:Calcipressin-like protein [Wickerhamomyces ciferrii]|uniref:Calcipressin-like protein n=1 Tax=Wickerhamomyces ciferrii (strain ATCC 14091 / BCRC 22168 / CBS 111 / JCM 3599 / NBRC 0793 / NRRL Y-1031 F-60-10) TaxID=1206466 RepID=K0KTD2_WICCF|nr:Calcipressin-like protein [Wickerhamomyces ciferrii]CCH45262.1 Calcipressin-like protein [Wickerhamomyces ciferrii]
MVELEDVTNTLILTGISLENLENNQFIADLQQEIVSKISNDDSDFVQFVVLKTFRRILIIFNNKVSSIDLYKHFKNSRNDFKAGYSLHDYANFKIEDNSLELPDNSRMFLISPPASPPIDFDYDREEEEPNKTQIYTHEELKEIFEKNQKNLEDIVHENMKTTKYSNNESNNQQRSIMDFEKEIVLNDSNDDTKPKIILNPINGENDHLIGKAIQSFRTSLPPKSVFDEFDDDIIDDGDYS